MANLHISYFAILREQRGIGEETVATGAANLRELYTELKARHSFSLPAERLRVAVDGDFTGWETPVKDGQKVVFIPPVAGG